LTRDGKSATNFIARQPVTWEASGGTFSNVASDSVTWTAPNTSGTYTLSATNEDDETRTITLTVEAVIPVLWDWRKPVKKKKKVLVFEPEEGEDQTREKGGARRFYEIGAEDSSREDFEEMEAFWDAHHPNKKFIFDDPIFNRRTYCKTDAELNSAPNSYDGFDWNTAIKEAWPFGVSVPSAQPPEDNGLVEYAPSDAVTLLDALSIRGVSDGATVAVWEDATANGNDAVQPTGANRLTYREAETFDGLPYLESTGGDDYMTVPCAAGVKTILAFARGTAAFPSGAVVKFDANNQIIIPHASLQKWADYRKSGTQSTLLGGYDKEFSVLARVIHSSSSSSFYVDGALVETYTTHTDQTLPTSFTIGAGVGNVRMIVVFNRALTAGEIALHSFWIRRRYGMVWRFDFQNTDTGGLATEAVILQKEGFTGSRPLVLLNHYAGGTERSWLTDGTSRVLVSAMLDAGYIVGMSYLYGDNWGKQAAIDAEQELYDYIIGAHDIDTDKVGMVGASMGGLVTALSIPLTSIPIKCAAVYFGVLDLRAQYDYNGAMATSIKTQYGIAPDGSDYSTKTAGHDPILRSASDYAGVGFRFYGSPTDTVVQHTPNTADFAAHINGVALENDIVIISGAGHLERIDETVEDLMSFFEGYFA
jgi:hypothetical protein